MKQQLILGIVLASTLISVSHAAEKSVQADSTSKAASSASSNADRVANKVTGEVVESDSSKVLSAEEQPGTIANSVAAKKAKSKADNSEEPNPAIRLESVFVGDKEQPAISYFIPWQGVGAPDKLHWNVEEKHDKALELVDREIMLRSIHFYGEMNLENKE